MAIRQKLKGEQTKTYDVLINFNRGIDKQAADDLASDSSFRELSNFYNKQDGVLSKRPGIYDTKFTDVMKDVLSTGELCSRNVIHTFDNQFDKKFSIFVNNVLNGERLDFRDISVEEHGFRINDQNATHFKPETLIGIQILKDDNFHTLLEKYKVGETNICGVAGIPDNFEFNILVVCSGYLEQETEIHGSEPTFVIERILQDNGEFLEGVIITKLHIKKSGYHSLNVTFDIEQVSTVYNAYVKSNKQIDENDTLRWGFNLGHKNTVDIASYNDYSYIPTGSDYIIRVKNEFPETAEEMGIIDVTRDGYNFANPMKESNMITQIGGAKSENLYEPTPVEASNIGFNILAKDPLSAIKNEGTTDAVKGVFYTVLRNGVHEPISDIPSNAPFSIHIVNTGSSNLGTPEYREDNGETDVSINPYKPLTGSFDGDIFNCDGINFNGKLELKFTKGTATFISYVSTGTTYNKQVGTLADVTKLIYSSSRIKVINSQLVLYGGHGYIFFSDYDNFGYFPNYFYVYAISEADEEEITSINYFRQYYAVFTNKKIKRMSGTFGSDNFGLYPLSDFIGCPNGRTIKQVNNNLLFVGIDGVYKLKQGYLGEGTENVEKIDNQLGNIINSNNVSQCFVLNDYYLIVRNDNNSIIAYNFVKETFFEIKLESSTPLMALNPNIKIDGEMLDYYFDSSTETCYEDTIPLHFGDIPKDANPFKLCFQNELFDEHGSSIYIPEYSYDFTLTQYTAQIYPDEYPVYGLRSESGHIALRKLRISDLEFIEEEERHKDGIGFISELETPKLSMGSPTNTKKFKSLYIKMTNSTGHAIPLYITIYIDDVAYITPEDYEVKFDSDTETFYYIYTSETNATLAEGAEILKAQDVLGELVLGEDKLGNNTVYQLKIKINKKGRSIKIKISDGYNDIYDIIPITGMQDKVVTCERSRNTLDFTITAIGIVYKLKKVKEG